MSHSCQPAACWAVLLGLIPSWLLAAEPGTPSPSAARAIAYLRREAASWTRENGCRSCHNQGDAARVVFSCASDELLLGTELKSTRDWLLAPDRWSDNQGDPRFSDQQLAVIQFSSALAELVKRDATKQGSESLRRAALQLVRFQQADGAWHIDTGGVVGSPITYGTELATAQSVNVLRQANAAGFSRPIAAAETYLTNSKTGTVLGAAAVLIGLPEDNERARRTRRLACQSKLLAAQHGSGGWGPYAGYAPEIFDTAVAISALRTCPLSAEVSAAIGRGRTYLESKQLDDGSWEETTRPDPQESYAHHVSTSAWATSSLALRAE